MDAKEAARLLATAPTEKKIAEPVLGQSSTWSKGVNRKEEAMVDAIDMKRALEKYADLVTKLSDGHMNLEGAFNRVAPDAFFATLEIMMSSDSDKLKLEAAKDILDRAGYSKVNKHAVASVDPNVPKAQLISMIEGLAKKADIEIVSDEE